MSTSFNKAVTWVLELEGYFSDHNQDPGGKTKYGITEATWASFRKAHPDRDRLPGQVKDISTGHAIAVYEQEYWRKSRCHELAEISEPVAIEVFDAAVNCGQRNGGLFLQKALNFLRHPGWLVIAEDGVPGPQTQARLRELIPRYTEAVVTAQNGYQFMHYDRIVGNNPNRFLHFSRGWMKRVQLYGEDIDG